MKRYAIPLIMLLLLFGCTSNKPNLSVSFTSSPPVNPYEGDAVMFSINVVNSGNAAASDFMVDIFVNNVSLKTDSITLSPNSNQTISYTWYPYTGGEYDIVAKVDAGNLVSDASPNKQSAMHVSVLPVQPQSLFSVLPDRELRNVGITYITSQGISSATAYLPSMSGVSIGYLSMVLPYIKNFKDVGIGTLDYADNRSGMVIFIRGPVSAMQAAGTVASFLKAQTGMNSTLQYKIINGTNVTILSSPVLAVPVCIWREGGWTKLTFYSDPQTLETCDSLFGVYNSSYAEAPLSVQTEFVKYPPFNSTLLGETLQIANLTNTTTYDYGAAFEDAAAFYGYYVVKEPYVPRNYTCMGRVLTSGAMQICETPQTNSTWIVAQRRVGNYTIACLATPKAGADATSVEQNLVNLCFSLNYSGEERSWVSILTMLRSKRCELPDGFSCLSYNFTNATLYVDLTQNTGNAVVINGFGCSSVKNVSVSAFQFPQPVTLPSNSSVMLNSPCYDLSGVMNSTYSYFDTQVYLNYSVKGSNESKVIVGNLTINTS